MLAGGRPRLGSTVGGISLFVGTVRNRDQGADVVSLDYTQHPSALDVLTRCAEETADQHDVLAIRCRASGRPS
jgi:molybdopterin synthase catalytic subunit